MIILETCIPKFMTVRRRPRHQGTKVNMMNDLHHGIHNRDDEAVHDQDLQAIHDWNHQAVQSNNSSLLKSHLLKAVVLAHFLAVFAQTEVSGSAASPQPHQRPE